VLTKKWIQIEEVIDTNKSSIIIQGVE